jgi:hypothetical protein
MYEKPAVMRFGTLRELTQAGCTGGSDGLFVPGIGTSIGNMPIVENGTTLVCFVGAS